MRLGLSVVVTEALMAAVPLGAGAAPPPPIAAATAVGPDGGRLVQSDSIFSRDQAASAPLDGVFASMRGTSTWIFGDTFLAGASAGADCDHLATDSHAYSSRDTSTGINVGGDTSDSTGSPTEFLPRTGAEALYNAAHHTLDGPPCKDELQSSTCRHTAYGECDAEYVLNAGAVIADPARLRLLYFFDVSWRLRKPLEDLTRSTLCVDTVGAGVASWSPKQRPQLRRLYFTHGGSLAHPSPYVFGNGRPPTDDPDPHGAVNYTGPQYGQAPLIPPGQSRYLYLYDTTPPAQWPDCGTVYCYKTKLARVPLATLTDVSTWRFYDAKTPLSPWKRSGVNATYLRSTDSSGATSAGPPGFSVTYNAYLRKYVMFYQRVGTPTIGYRTASNPWGPWSAQGIVPFREVAPGPGGMAYAAQAHDEFSGEFGKVMYLTYVASNTAGGVYVVRVVFR
ncbi:MAG: hypothetical protein ACXVH3_25510 [Solirubrobacteraceae bacterium]